MFTLVPKTHKHTQIYTNTHSNMATIIHNKKNFNLKHTQIDLCWNKKIGNVLHFGSINFNSGDKMNFK